MNNYKIIYKKMEKDYIKSGDFYCDGKNWYYYGYKDYIEYNEDNEDEEDND